MQLVEDAAFPEELGGQSKAVLVAWAWLGVSKARQWGWALSCVRKPWAELCVSTVAGVHLCPALQAFRGRCQSSALGHIRRRSPRCREKAPQPVLSILSPLAAGHGSGCTLEEARRNLSSGYRWDKEILIPAFGTILIVWLRTGVQHRSDYHLILTHLLCQFLP